MKLFQDKISLLKELKDKNKELEEQKNLTEIILTYLKEPQLMLGNEKTYLQPLKNYIKELQNEN